ncbi:MAG: CHAT domain-containing tetratricopeptide repeat protein [Bacteroidetes bacterium]|jgi:tetratricopeptide (TPR) repeat protein|nr:CHAT domain-containing tetratricopeptide repeat protein [Bacteroidota bacterium]
MILQRPRTRLWLPLVLWLAWSGCDATPAPAPLPVELFEQGVALVQNGDLVNAAPLFDEAERQYAAAGRRDFQLQALSYGARIARDRGSFRDALDKARRGARLARQLGDVRAEMMHRLIEGEVYTAVGLPSSAARSYEEAIRLADTFNEPAVQAEAEIALAALHQRRRAADAAGDRFTLALTLAQSAKRDDIAAQALLGLAEVFLEGRKPDEAVNSATQAITLVDGVGQPLLAAKLRLRFGSLLESARNVNAALTTYREGVNLLRRSRAGRQLEIQMLYRIGELYAKNQRPAEARKYFNDAYEIARRERDAIAQAYLALRLQDADAENLTAEQRATAWPRLARAHLGLADQFRSIGQTAGEAAAAGRAAEAFQAMGDQGRSTRLLRRAATVERLNLLSYADPVLHRPYLDRLGPNGRQGQWADRLAARAFATDAVVEGLTVLEQYRQSIAADGFEEAEVVLRHPSQSAAAAALRSDWSALRLASAEFGASLSLGGDPAASAQALAEIYRGSQQLFRRAQAVASAYPNYSPIVRADSVSVAGIRGFIPRGLTVVEYLHDGTSLVAVAITREGAKVYRQQVDAASIKAHVDEYLRLLQDPLVYTGGGGEASLEPMTRFAVLSTELYDLFIRPLEPTLDRGIVFIESDLVGKLPFHALEKQDRGGRVGHLIEYGSVDYLSSWAALQYPTRPALRMQSIVAFGNPSGRNWSTDYELRDIRSFFRLADIAIGRDATWSGLRSKRPDLLQLATSFRPGLPIFGTFLAADSARTDATIEVAFERLSDMTPPPVVILSDDLSDAGGLRPEHALLLRVNGTSDIFLNRWTADRKASKFFSEFFFTHLSNGLAPGDAYRQALLNLIRTPDVSHPRSWAQFFHFGIG